MEDLVRCTDVVKIHRARGVGGLKRGFKAVDGVSVSIPKNASFGLVGESGCGKTTFARALMYLDPPTSGRVEIGGTELGQLSRSELRSFRKRMQIVFQDPNSAMNPKMSVFASLSEGLINRGIEPAEREKRIHRLLDLVGISSSYVHRYPHEFSGGQKQRLVIARALSMEPEFLVLDEPVSNLDVSIQAQIINLLSDLKDELSLTYLFISHDLKLVSYMCDTIGVMFKGRIVEQGSSAAIMGDPRHPYTRKLLSSIPGGSTMAGCKDDLSVEELPEPAIEARRRDPAVEKGCPYYPFCAAGSSDCLHGKPGLDDRGQSHLVACIKAGPVSTTS